MMYQARQAKIDANVLINELRAGNPNNPNINFLITTMPREQLVKLAIKALFVVQEAAMMYIPDMEDF